MLAMVAGLMLPALFSGHAWAEAEINARGWSHENFGRLVLDAAVPLVKSATIKDRKLFVEFREPVTVKLGDALSKLGIYVERTPDARGTILILTLLRPVKLHQFTDGDKYVLDLNRTQFWPANEAASVAPAPATPAPSEPAAKPPEKTAAKPAQVTAAPAPAGKPKIVVRQGEHPGFIRFAFDWPRKTGYSIERRDGQVVVSFERAAEIDLKAALKELPTDLVKIAARDEDVARVYLTMAEGSTLRDFRLGSTVVLDVMQPAQITKEAAPVKLPDAKAPDAKAAETKTNAAPQTPAPDQMTPAAGEQAAEPQPQTPPAVAQQPIAEPPAPAEAPQLTLKSLPDLPQPLPAAPTATLPAPPENAPVENAPVENAPAAEADAPAQETPAQPETTQEPKAEEPKAAAEPANTPPPMPEIEQVTLPPRPPVDVNIVVAPSGDGAKITFTWPESVAAAAFRRGNALWLAFDRAANSVAPLISDARVAKLGRAEKVEIPDATVIRIAGDKPLGVALTASGRSWIVDVAPGGKIAPFAAIEQRRETLADGAASLLLATSNPGRVVSLADAASGEQLQVVPVRPAGQGIAAEVAWPEFKLLPTHQGIVIAARPEAVTVESLAQGVVVTTRPQGALAPIAEAPAEAPAPKAEETAESGAPAEEQVASNSSEAAQSSEGASEGANGMVGVPGLFDLPSWRRGGEATFQADQRQLQRAVTAASGDEVAAARLALVEFYFAHGLLDDARDALAPISTAGGKVDPREVRLLKAALQALHDQGDEAKELLADRDVALLPETNLFLGLIAAEAQDWPEAGKHFNGALPSLADYPKPVRDRLYMAGGQALANSGNPIGAQRFADALRQDEPDAETTDRLTYLDGLIKLKMGEREEGLSMWESLGDSDVPEIQARSQFALVEERMSAGEMKGAEAIRRLERLRFVDRGGDFEFNLLRKLGTLYLAENQPRRGLVTLRQTAANFSSRPESKEIAEQMSRAFRELYMENGADRLSPLMAVALYDEFRELTPAGRDGDRMIGMLADRLVKVDLLDRAAILLDDLMKKRLTGLDKAEAGTRLASIQMLDQRPDLALKALEDSKIDEPLPPELVAQRNRLAARATFDSGNELGGLKMLADDPSLEAKWLRADMLWRTREWPAAANALGDLIDGEEAAMADEVAANKAAHDVTKDPSTALTSEEADAALKARQEQHFKERIAPLILNRAVALSLASDRRGLKALARDYGEAMAATDQAKAFDMLTSPDNGLIESVTAEMTSVERIDAFVTDYREKLKAASLSEPPAGGS
ncbi:MAG TPA: hypothetical protein VG742_04515 [Dongiaceae bacterium]|nr:hypothetical protein [Dongiaceae bacterium]